MNARKGAADAAKPAKKPKKRICDRCIRDCKQPPGIVVVSCNKYRMAP